MARCGGGGPPTTLNPHPSPPPSALAVRACVRAGMLSPSRVARLLSPHPRTAAAAAMSLRDEALSFTSTQRRRMTVAKTFSRQGEVPRLPLPSVEKTVEKYLVTVQPY